jgi:hypothetical protein
MMTTQGFLILIALVALLVWIYVEMAKYPGAKARERGHRQAEAIAVLSWLGLLLGFVPWVLALVWAHTDPQGPVIRTVVVTEPTEPAPDSATE